LYEVLQELGCKELELMEKYKDIYGVLMLNRLTKANVKPIFSKKLNHLNHHARSVDFDSPTLPYYPVDNPYDFLFQTYWETFYNDPSNYLL
jgi:hypothetical protein